MYKNLYNIILLAVAVIAIAFGVWGFSECTSFEHAPVSQWLTGILSLIAFNLVRSSGNLCGESAPLQLVLAQIAVPAVALLATAKLFLAGVRRDIRVALARRKRNHIIVCGLGNTGMQVVQNLREAGEEVVVVELNGASQHVLTCESQGVPVITGDAKNIGVIRVAGIQRARALVAVTGIDAENMDIALRTKTLVTEHPRWLRRRLTVHVELRSDWLFSKLANLGVTPLGSAELEMRLFSTHANAARMLIGQLRLPPIPDIPADAFVVIGFGPTGREVTQQIMRAAPVALDRKVKIVVFDKNAEAVRQEFFEDFPAAPEFADIDFVSGDLWADTPGQRGVLEEKLRSETLLGVAVCLDDDEASLYVALEARAALDRLKSLHVPVFVRLLQQRRLGDFAGDLHGLAKFHDRIRVFGALEDLFSPEIFFGGRLDSLARAFHEDYSAGVGGTAGLPWHDLPEFMKASNRWRADHTPIMLALAGLRVQHAAAPVILELTAQEIEMLARLEHRRYRIERRLLGWDYGPVRDQFDHKHPDLTDWDKLSQGSRDYNIGMVTTLPKILARVGLEVRRENRIRAYGAAIGNAAAAVERAKANGDGVHHVVIADIDRPEGRAAAEQSLALERSSLWLMSQGAPRELYPHGPQVAAQQLYAAIRQAEGWVRSSARPAPDA